MSKGCFFQSLQALEKEKLLANRGTRQFGFIEVKAFMFLELETTDQGKLFHKIEALGMNIRLR